MDDDFYDVDSDSISKRHLIKDPRKLIRDNKFDIILDVRTVDERKAGYLDSSYHIPLDKLSAVFPKEFPDRDIKILMYCRSGRRTRDAVLILKHLGYKNIYYTNKNFLELAQ